MSETPPKQTWRQRIVQVAKWVWLLAALLGFIAYFLQNQTIILAEVQRVGLIRALIVLLLVAVGRIMLVWIANVPLLALGKPMAFTRLYIVFSVTDMAKYIPGGIWHFLGRASYYHDHGLTARETADSLLKENLWLAFVSGASAGIWIIVSLHGVLHVSIVPIVVLTILVLRLWTPTVSWGVVLGNWAVQSVMWALYGISFAILFPTTEHLALASGAFILSWMIGFLTIFAPGGIGVREAVLVAVLAPVVPINSILVLAILHRFLWTLVELLLGGSAFFFVNRTR